MALLSPFRSKPKLPMKIRRALLILTMTAPLFAYAEGGVLGFIKKVGTHIDSMTIRGVDRQYIEMPEKPWQVILQGNVNQSVLKMDALVDASRLNLLARDTGEDTFGDLSWEPRIKTPDRHTPVCGRAIVATGSAIRRMSAAMMVVSSSSV